MKACLVKDPDERIETAHDLLLQLRSIADDIENTRPTAQSRARTAIPTALWAFGGAAIALAAMLAIQRAVNANKPPVVGGTVSRSVIDLRDASPLALGQYFPRTGVFSPLLTLSHDGSTLVYVGFVNHGTQLFKRRLDRYEVEPIAGTEGVHYGFFSADDAWIGFLTNDKVMKVPVEGGSAAVVADVNAPIRASWLSNGTIAVGDREGTQLKLIGDRENQNKTVDLGSQARFIDMLPDGRSVLVSLREKLSADFNRVGIFDIEKRNLIEILDGGYDARYVAPDRLLFVRGGDLHAVRFDATGYRTIGKAIKLQTRIATDSFSYQAQYAISGNVLAYIPGGDRAIGRLAWVDRKGSSEFLPLPERPYGVFDISPDGRKIAVQVADITDYVWVFDLSRMEGRRIPGIGNAWSPRWTPDGREIVAQVRSPVDQSYQLLRIDPAGSTAPAVLHSSREWIGATAISPDQRFLAIYELVQGIREGIKTIGESSPVRWFPHVGWGGDFSPDGRWLVHASSQTGRYEIWVNSVQNMQEGYQISVEGGVEPVWCRSTGEIFYRNGSRWYAVRISTDGSPKWEAPRLAWETDYIDTPGISYDVSPDGKRLLVSKRTSADVTDRVQLIQNWPALLQ